MDIDNDRLGHLYNLVYSYPLFRYVAELTQKEEVAWELAYEEIIDPGGEEPVEGPWWEIHAKILNHYVAKEDQENPA